MGSFRNRVIDVVTGLSAVTALVVAISVYLDGRERKFLTEGGPPKTYSAWATLAEAGHSAGPQDAPVTIIQFSDYECPSCRAMKGHLEFILSEFPGQIRLVYRHWPLRYHELAYPAARAAECAGAQGLFWPYNDLLYSNSEWLNDPDGHFLEFAEQIQIPAMGSFELCLADSSPVPAIERDILAMTGVGNGTPSVLVND